MKTMKIKKSEFFDVYQSSGVGDARYVYQSSGADRSLDIVGSSGVSWSLGVVNADGVSYSLGVADSSGVSWSWGLYKCKAASKCIFCYKLKAREYALFNKPCSKARYAEVFTKLREFGWTPKWANWYVKGDKKSQVSCLPQLKIVNNKIAWSMMPPEMRKYIFSLPEFDRKVWDAITG